MRPEKPKTTRSRRSFLARLDQIINLRHELAQLAGQIDWDLSMPLIVKALGIGRAKLNRRQRSACRGGYRNAFNPCPNRASVT